MKSYKPVVALVFIAILTSLAGCQKKPSVDYLNETAAERDTRMEWWRDARFGMFIHWGLYAVPAGEYKGQKVKGIGEWIQAALNIPRDEYEHFAPKFNPEEFDAAKWVSVAKAAGMKYLVITSKHHDGFALWDSKVSDWDIIDRTPYKKDIMAALSAECKKQGLIFCMYHSILDWHHPSQFVDPDAENTRQGHARNKIHPGRKSRFVKYLKGQLKELVVNYDPGVLWFDGEWVEWWTEQDGRDLYDYVRNLKPDIIINNRVGKGRMGMDGMNKGPEYVGDFGTPEQKIPDQGLPGVDWESCMTMNDTWGFKYFDNSWKSTQTLVQNLIDIASKGGNYLLNIGPTARGLIPSASVDRLNEMGKWMRINGESIYGTSASPYEKPEWGRYTARQKTARLYVHIFDYPRNKRLEVSVPSSQVVKAYGLANPDEMLKVDSKKGKASLRLPGSPPDELASVFVIEYTGEL